MYNITVKKTLLISIIILLFSQINQIAAQNQKIDSSYFREIENWDKQRERNLRSENGWLNIIGLNWLNEGVNFIGSDTSCSIQLPNERCEKILGNFKLKIMRWIKGIWNGMDEQNKILLAYMLFLALLVLVSII
jgi:hypothetical protein